MNLQTRRRRRMRENFKKAFIWVFVAFFVISIVGVAIVTVAPR